MRGGPTIHPMAVVEDGAQIGDGVSIGPFCHIGKDVRIGDDVELISHVTILGHTTLGQGAHVFPNVVLGCAPQNHAHKGGPSTLEIGINATIREGVTIHTGTDTARARTIIGDNCNFLGNSHVGHDCAIGNNVTLTQGAMLAGHCEVGDFAILGGMAAVHQFARIGHHAFVGGMTGVERDLIPYGMVTGNRARLRGLNIIGMRRSGIAREEIAALRAAYKLIFNPLNPVQQNIVEARERFSGSPVVMDVLDFMNAPGKRLFVMPDLDDRHTAGVADDAE